MLLTIVVFLIVDSLYLEWSHGSCLDPLSSLLLRVLEAESERWAVVNDLQVGLADMDEVADGVLGALDEGREH